MPQSPAPRLWRFAAAGEVTEVLEARTDVLQAEAGEQRLALRSAPRAIVTLRHRLDAVGLARAAELARAGFAGDWWLPLWHLARQPTAALVQGADSIAVETGLWDLVPGDLAPGDLAAVAVDGGPAALVEIASVTGDALRLAAPLLLQLPGPQVAPGRALVAPVRAAILVAPVEVQRRRQGDGMVTASFLLRTAPALTPPAGDRHLGHPVLNLPPVLRQPLAATLARPVEYVDSGLGPVAVEPIGDRLVRGETLTLRAQGPMARHRLRGLLAGLRGRQASFWLPSWGRELQLVEPAPAGATSLRIRPVAGLDACAGRSIVVETPGGLQYCSIASAAERGVDHVLTLAESLATALPVTTAIHLMTLSRADADRVEIVHGAVASEVSLPVVEVPA